MSCSILHTELSCALGTTISECTDNLLQGRQAIIKHTVEHLQMPVTLPYYSLGGNPLVENHHQRLWPILTQQLDDMLNSVPLSPKERKRTGLFIGSSSLDVEIAEHNYKVALEHDTNTAVLMPQIGYNNTGSRLQQHYGLSQYQFTVTTACTSSANAMLTAKGLIETGKIDHAIIIGYEAYNETTFLGFNSLALISPTASFKPFDKDRNGLVLGEGCAALLISREHKQGCMQLAGGAIATDSHSLTAANPDGSSIANVIYGGLENANTQPESIRAIKAHGTASVLNDDAESAGLQTVFSKLPPIFALKPYTGHTLGACGAIETALTVELLRRNIIPANNGIAADNTVLGIALNQEVITAPEGHYLFNFYAFGGNNTALVLKK